MDSNYYRDIMEALKELSVEQATLKERVESHLKQSERLEDSIKKLETSTPTIERHEVFMKASLWFYGLLISSVGLKYLIDK